MNINQTHLELIHTNFPSLDEFILGRNTELRNLGYSGLAISHWDHWLSREEYDEIYGENYVLYSEKILKQRLCLIEEVFLNDKIVLFDYHTKNTYVLSSFEKIKRLLLKDINKNERFFLFCLQGKFIINIGYDDTDSIYIDEKCCLPIMFINALVKSNLYLLQLAELD
jgi:hypothetical protein